MDNKKCNTQLLSMFLVLVSPFTLRGGDGEAIRCIEKERQALLKFKQELVDDHDLLSSWGSEANKRECCEWIGVECSGMTGQVIGLNLVGETFNVDRWHALRGNISNALVDLHHLIRLDLSFNQLGGPIPDAFSQKFVFLEYLDLSYNRFEGGIPKSLWNLASLKNLYLSHNNLLGPLPEFVASGELSKLEVLDVSFNSLQGKISETYLSKLHNLKELDLSYNSLVLNLTTDWTPPFQLDYLQLACCDLGSRFPTWVLTQSNVSYLDLSCTNISDELPKLFWDSFPRLELLNLSHNQISDKLPDLSSKLFVRPLSLDLSFNEFSGRVPSFHPKTTHLYLSNNKFSGTISFVCKSNIDELILLDLSNNQLSGQLPDCWENISLVFLDLSNNSFSGKIPNSLGGELFTLHLGNNNLSGEFPSGFNNSLFLIILDVGGNKLTGNIPAWIGTVASLMALNIRDNNFSGSIPPEICRLTQIQILDLSRNNLSGEIPLHCFENFTYLIHKDWIMFGGMDKIVVQLKGNEYEYSKTVELLKLIDLSSNRIEGNIPTEIFQLEGLISLNLSRNHLRGNIDPAIHRLESLESLDLSRNQLSGEIPMGLGTLASLGFLDLSNNNFSGKIPSGTQLQGFDASAYAGNIGLCGPPLPKCPEDGPSPLSGAHGKLDDGDENDDALTIQSFLKEFYIAIVLGFIVGFWGIIGTLLLKRSWRYAYFQFLDRIKDCLCLEAALCMRRLRVERPHIQS